jgi:hypothetical protein
MKVSSSTLRLDRLEPELPAGGTSAGRTVVRAGAVWTGGRGAAGFAGRTTGFAFFAVGFA